MFDFLFQNKKGELQSYMDAISIDIKRLMLSKLAIEKATNMIAHAIAKSEFVVQRKDGRKKDHIYWLLNIRPNPNETATEFWIEAIRRLLLETECLICFVGNNLYIVDSYSVNDSVMQPQAYSDVCITSNDKSIKLTRGFTANEMIHLKAKNKKIMEYLKNILSIYDKLASTIAEAKKISGIPKFTFTTPAQMPLLKRKKADGSEEILTADKFKNEIKRMLESDNIELLQNSYGIAVEQLKIDTQTTSEDIVKMGQEISKTCALVFDIPQATFMGEITEKADSTNEFITYAVGWIVELINDSLNAKMVDEEDYLKGECIWIDMSRYKHRDIIESAANLDKLRSIGYNYDEIREMTGWEALNTEFSKERVVTKNYTNQLGGENEE